MVEEQDGETTFAPINISKNHLHVEQFPQNNFLTLAEDPKPLERKQSPWNEVGQKTNQQGRQRIVGQGPVPQGGSPEGGKVPTHQEAPSQAGAGGAPEPQREVRPDRRPAGKWRKSTAEMVRRALASQTVAHMPTSAHREWGPGGRRGPGCAAGKYPEVAHRTQNKDPALENAEAGQAFFSLEPQRQRSRQEDQRPKVGATTGSTPDTSTAAEL